jgi:hypothetical protein
MLPEFDARYTLDATLAMVNVLKLMKLLQGGFL